MHNSGALENDVITNLSWQTVNCTPCQNCPEHGFLSEWWGECVTFLPYSLGPAIGYPCNYRVGWNPAPHTEAGKMPTLLWIQKGFDDGDDDDGDDEDDDNDDDDDDDEIKQQRKRANVRF